MPDIEVAPSKRIVLRRLPDFKFKRLSSDRTLAVGSEGSEFEFVKRFRYALSDVGYGSYEQLYNVTDVNGRVVQYAPPRYRHCLPSRYDGVCCNCAFRTRANYCQYTGRQLDLACRAFSRADGWSGFWRLIRRK